MKHIEEEHEHYTHFESWVSSLCGEHAKLPLYALVAIYTDLYPGRTYKLLAELIPVARLWTKVYRDQQAIQSLGSGTYPDQRRGQ
jgi:hypothetical protein